MLNLFHRNLNRMVLFVALVAAGVMLFWRDFMQIACANIWLNGVIIGTTLFGIIICFVQIFGLLPDWRWVRQFIGGRVAPAPRGVMRTAAIMIGNAPGKMSPDAFGELMDLIAVRFDDSRETVRYITNTLIFLGLLGTFWGLILTVGGFAEMIGGLDMADESVLDALAAGLSRPLYGMATAFTSSLMGLAGSLVVGFLGLQVNMAQNAMMNTFQDYVAAHTEMRTASYTDVRASARDLNGAVRGLGKIMGIVRK